MLKIIPKILNGLIHFFNRFHSFCITVFCVVIIYFIGPFFMHFLHSMEQFNPLTRWEDVELSDINFSFHNSTSEYDDNIVLVDCAGFEKVDSPDVFRRRLATEIGNIMQDAPKAIGIDIQFEQNANTKENKKLKDTLVKYKDKVVLGVLHDDSVYTANLPFYLDLMTEESPNPSLFGYVYKYDSCKILREFIPYIKFNDFKKKEIKTRTSFAVKMLEISKDTIALDKLLKRKKYSEVVNYKTMTADTTRFRVINSSEIKSYNFKDKYVLIGDCNKSSFVDYHFSPLNKRVQRAYPDLKGVEYHANVLSMLLAGDYIDELFLKGLWIFLLCWLGIYFFLKLNHTLYHLLLDLIIILLSFGLMHFSVFIFRQFHIKIEPSEFIVPLFVCGLLMHLYKFIEENIKKYDIVNRIISKFGNVK